MNVVEVIRRETAAHAARTAVADGPDALTYAELLARAAAFAAELRAAGVAPGRRVAVLCEDCADYVIATLAVLEAGGVVVPVSPSLMHDEVAAILDRIAVRFVLAETGPRGAPAGRPAGAGVFLRRAFRLDARPPGPPDPPGYDALHPAFIRFSSGTTGASKGVLLTHESILTRTAAANRGLEMTPADTVYWVLSMSFHFVVTILLFLRRACTIVLCGRAFPQSLLDGMARRRGTFLYASPFHYHILSASSAFAPDSLRGVRMAVSTAMALPADVARAFADKFGLELTGAYGIIEVGLPFVDRAPRANRRGSVGRALPDYEVRIHAPDAAGVGEIRLRGPGMFDAYFSPWQPRAEAAPDGWFRTGDLGRLDADGALTIAGREKSVINFAGMKIFPQEVEEVLNQHPAVRESLVYPAPHPPFGAMPCARVVPHDPAAPPDPAELRRFCLERLAPHKVPGEFERVAALEKTASGKLKRAAEARA